MNAYLIIKIILKIVLDCLILFVSICLLFSIYYLFHGSFELYPTEEQIEKAKIASVMLGMISLVFDIILVKFRVKILKKEKGANT